MLQTLAAVGDELRFLIWPGLQVLACCSSILLPPGMLRLASAPPIFAALYGLSPTTSTTVCGYALNSISAIFALRWLDVFVFHSPEKDLRSVRSTSSPGGKTTKTEEALPSSPFKRYSWFLVFWVSFRNVGYSTEVSSLPPPLSDTKATPRFLYQNLLLVIREYIGLDIASTLLRYTMANHIQHTSVSTFLSSPPLTQSLAVWFFILRVWSFVRFVTTLATLLTCALGIFEPSQWRPVNGSFWQQGITVRKAWGTVWHQNLRRPCSQAGMITRDFLGLRKGSWLSSQVQLWMAFAVSALVHHGGGIGMRWMPDGEKMQAQFFLSQAAAIMVEDAVVGMGRMVGVKESSWTRLIGKLWVIAWFSFATRWWISGTPTELYQKSDLPSLIEYMQRRWV